MPPPEGLLLVDKPGGPTSHDIVELVRRVTRQSRIGHTGTLDPMATGLLPLLLGRATRLARFLPSSPKVYTGSIRLGMTTTTDDVAGEVMTRFEAPLPSADAVAEAARSLCGRTLQIPPAVSARRMGGERLYRLARRGVRVEAPPSEIDVVKLELAATRDPSEWSFRAEVSAGTYIRALARDLGASLGCGGAVSSLRRVSIATLGLETAMRLRPETLPADADVLEALVPIEEIPLTVPPVVLREEDQALRFSHGRAVPAPDEALPHSACRVLASSGELLGIADVVVSELRPRVVLPRLLAL